MNEMNSDDFVKEDKETRQWLQDIESFRSPPPPRKLTAPSDSFSREGSSTFGHSVVNGDVDQSLVDDGGDFINKVKQFQLSDSHPYANKSRVETTKKIAAQGGTMGGMRAMTAAEEKNKKFITKDQVSQLREHVRRESRPLNPYPSPYSEIEQSKRQQPTVNINGGSDYSSSAYSSYSSAIDRTDRQKTNGSSNLLSNTDGRSNTAGSISPSYSVPSPVHRPPKEEVEHIYRKSDKKADSFNTEPYRRIVFPPTKENVLPDPLYNVSSIMKLVLSPSAENPSNGTNRSVDLREVDNYQMSNFLNDRELSAAFDDFDKDYNDLSNRSMSPSLQNSQMVTSQSSMQSLANGGVLRAPPPPYHRTNINRLPSPSVIGNHYRQSSSPISAPSPPVGRIGVNRYSNNVAPIRTRSQSMQEVPSDQDFNANRLNSINYERAVSGRDIIIDRIPSTSIYSCAIDHDRSVQKSESFNDSLNPNSLNVQGSFVKAFISTIGKGVSGSQDSIRVSPADALEQQQRRFMQLEAQVEEELQLNAIAFGVCHHCEEKVTNPAEATQALGHLYHARCFTCCSCGRALKGKKFYDVRGRVYCEEDYLFSGFQQSAERCGICGHLIMDMILQAVGKSFHPGCFRCLSCKESLDGVPFTMDDEGRVYCINDYHRLFAPKCAKCFKPITPSIGRDETVRVVAMQKNYHVDCYICEGCGLQLTDEPEKRCYPLGEHLLCHRCHIHWSRTGGAVHPITDL